MKALVVQFHQSTDHRLCADARERGPIGNARCSNGCRYNDGPCMCLCHFDPDPLFDRLRNAVTAQVSSGLI